MATIDKTNIETIFQTVLNSLSEKEKNVITRRVGINGEKETLQSIGNSFKPAITRERVRQIEDAGIRKIGRIIKATELTFIQDQAKHFIGLHGGIMTKEKLINTLIKESEIHSDMNHSVLEVIIHSDYDISKSKPKLGVKTYFFLPSLNKKLIDPVHKEAQKILARKKDVVDRKELYTTIIDALKSKFQWLNAVVVDSCLEVFEDIIKGEETLIGLTKWKILNPKTLKDKAIYVLKKERIPMHFIDISNKITSYLGEKVKVNTIHNELIRNEEFVLIWRGIYALKEWGFKPGTVLDVIVEVLKKNNGPMSTETIVVKVLKVRNVKKTTIYMNLQNKKVIERVGRNYYQLKA
jgi:hypothetical protein